MKKLISILLVLTLALSLVGGAGLTAFASEEIVEPVEEIIPAEEIITEEPALSEEPAPEEIPAEAPAEAPAEELIVAESEEPAMKHYDAEWTIGTTTDLTVKGSGNKAAPSAIASVTVDGAELDAANYTADGKDVKLHAAYLDTLTVGQAYNFVVKNDAEGTYNGDTTVTIKAAAAPEPMTNTTEVVDPAPEQQTNSTEVVDPAPAAGSNPAPGYYILDVGGKYVGFDMGSVQSGAVPADGKAVKGGYVEVIAAEGGFQLAAEDPPGENKYFVLSASATTGPASASAGVWNVDADGALGYTEGGVTYYIASVESHSVTSTTDKASAAKPTFIPTTKPSGGGGPGGGGSNNVYGNAITNASVPNLVYVDAPHWVNVSNDGHETEKTVTLQARFPEGVEANAMTFRWSFGEETFTDTVPASAAVDGVFTSSFTVSIDGLDVGVYPVSCSISYKLSDDDEIVVTAPDGSDTAASEGEDWTYTLGSETNLKVVTELRGTPEVAIDGTSVTVTDDTSTSPPTSYVAYAALEALTPGVHKAVVTADGSTEEHDLTIVDPNASAGGDAPALADGLYLIGIELDGVFYAMSNDGGSVKAVAIDKADPTPEAVWTAATDGGLAFTNNEAYLYYSSTAVSTRTSKAATAWSYADGHLSYAPTGGSDKGSVFYVSGIADGAFGIAKDAPESAASISILPTAGPSNVTVGDGYTYTLGINKDLVMPAGENGPHTVTLKGEEVAFVEDAEAGTITIAADVIEALSTGSYTIAIAGADGKSVTHTLTITSPPMIDVNVNVILAQGVKENSLITFSDVHESWDDVGTAVKDTIVATKGFIPSLIIATGDFNNNRVAGNQEAYITGCVNEIINRVSLQLAGIDAVWVSGNHDNGFATQYTNYNLTADLGINLDDYASGPVDGSVTEGLTGTGVISGTGIIFDTRSEGYRNNADSSSYADGLIVIGLNYEDGDAFESNNYGDGTEESDSVYKHIKAALDSAAEGYNGELIVISSHAGLHAVGIDEDSAKSASSLGGGNSYTITNSAAIVKLLNSYVDEYGMDIVWFFGHDHSKGEEEFAKLPGSTITSMGGTYGEEYVEEIELKFSYAHAGYVGSGAAGIHNNNYTYLTWDHDQIVREERVANGSGAVREFMGEDVLHNAGSTAALSFTLDRLAEYLEIVQSPMEPTAEQSGKILAVVPAGYDKGNVTYYDVSAFKYENDALVGEASEEDIAEVGGITITFPYPDGTDAEGFDFVVLHLKEDGTVEELIPSKTPAGLKVHVDSLSPFAIVYKAAAVTPAPAPGGQSKGQSGKRSPKTADDSPIVLWAVVLVLCAGTMVALPRRKWDK